MPGERDGGANAGRIVVVGLGPGGRDGLTLGVCDELRRARRIVLRTEQHPAVGWLRDQNIAFDTYDRLYEAHGQFADVYEAIVSDLMQAAAADGGSAVVYAVPGHPSVAETTVALLRERCPAAGIALRIVGGESFLDRAFAALGFDPADGFQLADATALEPKRLQPYNHIVIVQVYDAGMASDVKLSLMERYPDDFPVTVAHAIGVEGEERIETVPLYELDRIGGYGNLSLVYVPATSRDDVHYRTFEKLHDIVGVLRGPGGCPWDREQTHKSLRKYFIEETFEAVETIDNDDPEAMCEELGDVLLQIMLHARMEEEAGAFTAYDVIASLSEKLVRRHPHVFGDRRVEGVEDVLRTWQEVKAAEKRGSGEEAREEEQQSALAGVPSGLPGLLRAAALQKKAAKVGFDWDRPESIADKIVEELQELQAVLSGEEADSSGVSASGMSPSGVSSPSVSSPGASPSGAREERLTDELGDLLFAVVNLARFLQIDPEEAISGANRKFLRRFEYIERQLRLRDKSFDQTDIQELERYWQQAKKEPSRFEPRE